MILSQQTKTINYNNFFLGTCKCVHGSASTFTFFLPTIILLMGQAQQTQKTLNIKHKTWNKWQTKHGP